MTEMLPVKTYIRINPNNNCLPYTSTTVLLQKDTTTSTYTFDKVFGPSSTQKQIYKEIQPLISKFLSGQNATIFCYGSTGSGKTYTMTGNKQAHGLVQHIIADLVKTDALLVSYLEIYNEKIYDLLEPKEIPLRDYGGTVVLSNLKIMKVSTFDEFTTLFSTLNRKVGETSLNKHSSRSHAILRIIINNYKLYLIDLAGSENNRKSGNEGIRLTESSNINSSLFVLGKVVNAIVKKESRIPYRDSKLTRMLQDSLGGSSLCCIIANILGEHSCDTTNTLAFASQSRNIVNQKSIKMKRVDEIYIPGAGKAAIDRSKGSDGKEQIRWSNGKSVDNKATVVAFQMSDKKDVVNAGNSERPSTDCLGSKVYHSHKPKNGNRHRLVFIDRTNKDLYSNKRCIFSSYTVKTKNSKCSTSNTAEKNRKLEPNKLKCFPPTKEKKQAGGALFQQRYDVENKGVGSVLPCQNGVCLDKTISQELTPESACDKILKESNPFLNIRPHKSFSSDSLLLKTSFIDKPNLSLSPTTKEKSYRALLKRAEELEMQQNYKLALADYKIIQKFCDNNHIRQKIDEISALIRHSKVKVNLGELDVLYILNSGSFIDIKKLPKFGDKRAKAVVDFVSGGNFFESLSDLKLIFSEKIVKSILSSVK